MIHNCCNLNSIVLSFSQQSTFSSMNLSRRPPPTLTETSKMLTQQMLFRGISSTWQPATTPLPSCTIVCTVPRCFATRRSSSGTIWRTPLKNLSSAAIAPTDASFIKIWEVTFNACIWNQTKSLFIRFKCMPILCTSLYKLYNILLFYYYIYLKYIS